MKTIIVIDTQWMGHIPMYHGTIVERLLALGYRVISISPKAQKASDFVGNPQKKERAYFVNFDLSTIKASTKVAPLSRAANWWWQCANHVDMAVKTTGWEPDLVFFPGIETNIISWRLTGSMVDTLFPFKWSGLYLTPKYLRKPFLSFQYKKLFRKDRFFRARNCVGVAVLDEKVVKKLQPLVSPTPVIVMPDFTNSEISQHAGPLLKEIEVKSQGRKIIGLVGELSKRKGLITLIEVAKMAKTRNKDWFFVFCGPLNERNNNLEQLQLMQDKINRAPENCFFHLERIDNESQFNDVLCRSDVIFAAYEKFYHSSNLLTKAAIFAKPIIVSKGFCMEERVDENKFGLAIAEGDQEAAFTAIEALLNGKDLSGNSLTPQFESYMARHSLFKLDQFLTEMAEKVEVSQTIRTGIRQGVGALKGKEI